VKVSYLTTDSTGKLWVGTDSGIYAIAPDTEQLSQITGNLGSVDIRCLSAINQGDSELLFVGTKQGLYIGNLNTWEPVSELENRQITALICDDQILWVGTDRGLFYLRYGDNNWKLDEFNVGNSGLGDNRVIAIAISRDDSGEARLWVGTACGLSCYRY
jgi:ligand-binding sensor domain-containing protein